MVGMVCNKTGKTILQKFDKVLELMNHIISGLTICDGIWRYGAYWEAWDGQFGTVWYRLVWEGIGSHKIW